MSDESVGSPRAGLTEITSPYEPHCALTVVWPWQSRLSFLPCIKRVQQQPCRLMWSTAIAWKKKDACFWFIEPSKRQACFHHWARRPLNGGVIPLDWHSPGVHPWDVGSWHYNHAQKDLRLLINLAIKRTFRINSLLESSERNSGLGTPGRIF